MINLPKYIQMKRRPYAMTLIGEILIDEITNDGDNQTTVVVGGSPANIACNITDLGWNNINFFGSVGDDYYGRTLIQNFERKGLDTTYINITDEQTSIVRINKTEGSPLPSFYRGADSLISYSNAMEEAIINSSILHFTYWPLSTDPSKSTILKAIEVAKRAGTLIGFDPNYHVDLQGEDGLTPMQLINILPYIDIIKPSLDDSKRIFGEGYSIQEYFKKYTDLGIKLVVMTLGADGVIAHYDGQFYQQKSLATELVDATGAGDAFLSGLYSGILHGETIENILQIGSACSAENLKHLGAISYLPHLEELIKLYKIGE
jgi:fructokinase